MKRLFFSLPLVALAIAFACAGHARAIDLASPPPIPDAQATYAPTPLPTPLLPPGALPTPASNSATITFPRRKPKVAATPAPPKDTPARVGISGVWEIALQQASNVKYTHFKLEQIGTVLTGEYLDSKGKKHPLSGTVDGNHVRIVVPMPTGNALVFRATEDATTDMVGTLDTTSNVIGFTAAYRPKYNWADSINPSPGGGGIGGGAMP